MSAESNEKTNDQNESADPQRHLVNDLNESLVGTEGKEQILDDRAQTDSAAADDQLNGEELTSAVMTGGDSKEPEVNFFLLGIWFEGGLVVLALVLGWFGFCDSSQSLLDFDSQTVIQPAILWTLVTMIPLLLLLWASLKLDWAIFRSLRKTVGEQLFPLIAPLNIWQIALLSILAGFGEELFFRWSLQGGLAETMNIAGAPYYAAILVGLFFGICHFITVAYALLTAIIGVFLGWVMIESGTYLAPALAHSFYDFVAFLAIIQLGNREEILEKYQQTT